jgi:hypothetical protein
MAMLNDPDALGMFTYKVAFLEVSPSIISTDVILPVRHGSAACIGHRVGVGSVGLVMVAILCQAE